MVRDVLDADALIHLGTHGTQEFLPRKDRGLSEHDHAFVVLGIYHYKNENISSRLKYIFNLSSVIRELTPKSRQLLTCCFHKGIRCLYAGKHH